MISVCIATYNGARYIRQQLDSIMCQLSPDDEVIVSDDGSTDDTLDIVRSFRDGRIRIVRNSGGGGFVRNFENALNHSQGDYIFLSDQDDVWFPDKVRRCMEVLERCILLNHNSILTDGEGNPSGVDFFSVHHSKGGFWQTVIRNSYSGCCMAFRRELLKKALPFPPRVASHDIWLGLVAEKTGKTCFLSDPLLYYRRHGQNASSTSDKSRLSLLQQLRYRLYMLINVANR